MAVKDRSAKPVDVCLFEPAVTSAIRRVRRWAPPSNWSRADWIEEAQALAWCSAWEAARSFNPSRGVALGDFLRSRILAVVLTRYRREIAYARFCRTDIEADQCAAPGDHAFIRGEELLVLNQALSALSSAERKLMQQLYWLCWTERQVALHLGLSQQAVSLRKRMVLRKLRATRRDAGEARRNDRPQFGTAARS